MNIAAILQDPNLTKKEIVSRAEAEASALVEAANTNLLPTYINVKRAADYLDTFQKTIQKTALSEAQTYNERSFKAHGARIEVKEAGARWNYDKCNDPIYNDLKKQEEELAEKRKQREKFLQTISGHLNIVDEDSGDLITINAPIKTSSTTLAITY